KLAGFVLDITMRPDILGECYSHYRTVIAPTKFLRDAYVANGLKVPIHLLPFGVDLPRLPKLLKNSDSPVKFGFIGQIAPHKGVDILVDAFCLLPGGSAELHVFGPENQYPEYVADLKKGSAGFAVFFRGTFPKEKMADVFSELDFLVIPSRWYENSPLVLLNALASHTPVIISDVEGMTEFVEEGRNGFIFARGKPDELKKVLEKIVSEPERSRGMSLTTGYPRTTRMMVENVLDVYRSLVIDKVSGINLTASCES